MINKTISITIPDKMESDIMDGTFGSVADYLIQGGRAKCSNFGSSYHASYQASKGFILCDEKEDFVRSLHSGDFSRVDWRKLPKYIGWENAFDYLLRGKRLRFGGDYESEHYIYFEHRDGDDGRLMYHGSHDFEEPMVLQLMHFNQELWFVVQDDY